MGKINMNELTREQIQKAMACESVEELIELAKSEGIELTKEEAEAYMAEMEDVELDSDTLKQVAGGGMSYCSDLFTFKKAPEGCPNLEASR
jgi:predicted ribosomally synthesized peptide with nif11-like leader